MERSSCSSVWEQSPRPHAPVRHRRAARHPAEEGVLAEACVVPGVHGRALPRDAAAGHGHRPCEPRQVLEERVVALEDAGVGALLPLERGPADEVALARREADRDGRRRAAEDGDLGAVRADPSCARTEAGLPRDAACHGLPDGRGARVDQRRPRAPARRTQPRKTRRRWARVASADDACHEPPVSRQPQGGDAQLVAQGSGSPILGGSQISLALQRDHGDHAGRRSSRLRGSGRARRGSAASR